VGEVLVSAEEKMKTEILKTNSPDSSQPEGLEGSHGADDPGQRHRILVGVLPGTGCHRLFLCYALERLVSKQPEKFGKGAIEGCGTGGGKQCGCGRSHDPLFTLAFRLRDDGLMLGAMMMWGLRPARC